MSRLQDWKNPSDSWIFRQTSVRSIFSFEEKIASEKYSSAGIEPRSPLDQKLQSECSSTVLAGPGIVAVNYDSPFFVAGVS